MTSRQLSSDADRVVTGAREDVFREWCLCRWMSAYTSLVLDHRGEKAGIEERERDLVSDHLVSMCGPLSRRKTGWGDAYGPGVEVKLGAFGFEQGGIGMVATWDTREEADAAVFEAGDQDWTKVDKATPVSAFLFRTRVKSFFDGSVAKTEWCGVREAYREFHAIRSATGPQQQAVFQAMPVADAIAPYLPNAAESLRMWDAQASIDDRLGVTRNEREALFLVEKRSEFERKARGK